MAESKSMTVEQVVREVMAGEHADVLRCSGERKGMAREHRPSPSITPRGSASSAPLWITNLTAFLLTRSRRSAGANRPLE
jgi:hypothetical protein